MRPIHRLLATMMSWAVLSCAGVNGQPLVCEEQDLTGDGTADIRADNGSMWIQINRDDPTPASPLRAIADAGGLSGHTNFLLGPICTGGMVDQAVYWQTREAEVTLTESTLDRVVIRTACVDTGNGKEITREYVVTLEARRPYAWIEYSFTNTGGLPFVCDETSSHIHNGARMAGIASSELIDVEAYVSGVGVIDITSQTWWSSYSPDPNAPFATIFHPSDGAAVTYGFKAWSHPIHQIVSYYTGAAPDTTPHVDLMASAFTLAVGESVGWSAVLAFHCGGYAQGETIFLQATPPLPPDSLFFPSNAASPCDGADICQPVSVTCYEELGGVTVPVAIPSSVRIDSLSISGCRTEGWDQTTFVIRPGQGWCLAALTNTYGDVIEPGEHTLFNIWYHADPLCSESWYIHWDTTLSDDPFKQLKFSNAAGTEAIHPAFDPTRDSTEIVGYTPGDFNGDHTVDIVDLVGLVNFMFKNGAHPCVLDATDVNGNCEGPDIVDLVYLVRHMFLGGPDPLCGCLSTGGAPKLSPDPDVTLRASFADGITTVSLTSPREMLGIELELTGTGSGSTQGLLDNGVEIVSGAAGGTVRVGILDLEGSASIAAGQTALVQLEGEYEIVSALAVDAGMNTMLPTVRTKSEDSPLPTSFALHQNYPNPFNPVTEIGFSLPSACHVTLTVYNVMGQKVATLVNEQLSAGDHVATWDSRETGGSASGVYFYKLETPGFSDTKKMLLLK